MPDGATVAYLTQTTLSDEQVAPLVAALRRRYPRLRAPRTADVCYATQNRQAAVRWLAQYADHVLVLGDPTSSNSQRLVEVAMAEGVVAMLASSIDTVPESWLTAATVLGLTAGASTPDHLVQAAVARFVGAGVPVREKRLGAETTHFSLPKELDIPAVVLAGAAVAVVA
jgi:4-hydroxy-3-methylbut-2-enyl diphosphate reductase